MHLENVGAYRDDADEVVFGLNDFDDATVGPLRYDVLRLSTSVLLAGRGFRATGAQAIALVEHAVAAYLRGARRRRGAPRARAGRGLVAQAQAAAATRPSSTTRARGARASAASSAASATSTCRPTSSRACPRCSPPTSPPSATARPGKAAEWKVEDAAFRIAGNGSLGVLRVAVLVRDHAGDERLLELKECRAPSPVGALPAASRPLRTHPAERCARRRARPLRRAAAAPRAGRSSTTSRSSAAASSRRRTSSTSTAMHAGAELDELVRLHRPRRSARPTPAASRPSAARRRRAGRAKRSAAVIDHAVVLAGLLEGVYLPGCARDARRGHAGR